jgi:hypothetical protein
MSGSGKRFEALDGINTSNASSFGNTVTFSSNVTVDTNVLFVNTVDDSVGIMKAPTQGRLDVNGHIYATKYFGDGSSLSGVATNALLSNANNTYTNGRLTLSSNSSIVLSANSLIRFEDNRVLNFGSNSNISLLGNTSGLFVTGSNVNFVAATLFIDSGNNRVGIGTTVPSEALHVSGKIRIGTQATATTDAVRADRVLTAGDGLSGGGNLTSEISFAVDSNTVIRTTGNQTLGGTKTFTNAILMNGTSTNTNAAVRSDRTISTGDGLSGGGNLTANRTLTVDSNTVIRTTGNQTLGGTKTFSSLIVGSINGNAATVTNGVYTTGNQTIGGIKTFSSLIVGSINGNANTATTLQTTRAINGTDFNGSAAITTANWGTARNITIGGTTRSVNGSTTYSWTLADIGAAASTINLTAGDGLSGGGNLTENRTFAVNSSVIRTSGNQTIGGLKTFSANVQINANLTVTGDINNSSDIRLKTNVVTIENALNKVCNLRGVSYEKDGKESIGLIAQEVINIVPQVVNTDQEYMSVSYHNLIALLIEAVKELNDKIDNKA